MAPGIRDLATLEYDVVDRSFGQAATDRQPGVTRADDDDIGGFQLDDLDRDVGRIRNDVEDSRALL